MKEMVIYQCPNCGGPLKFDPEKQKYACEFCLSVFTQENLEAWEKEKKGAQGQKGVPVLYTCPSCGA